ncbi:MAG: arsenite efflux transporter metallochaperone ArsD [Bacillota bacterium]
MKSISIYDPAMCCSTGVCGPSPDKELIRVAAELKRLAETGIDVKRFNLSQQPVAFVQQAEVRKLLQEQGPDVLPVILVEDEVRLTGRYPTAGELAAWTAENVKGDL